MATGPKISLQVKSNCETKEKEKESVVSERLQFKGPPLLSDRFPRLRNECRKFWPWTFWTRTFRAGFFPEVDILAIVFAFVMNETICL